MKTNFKTVETIKFKVHVTGEDIGGGKCGLPTRCMEKVAIERTLRSRDPQGGDHKVRVDAGVIRFNLNGWRFEAMTPREAKVRLIQFDKEAKVRRKAEAEGKEFKSRVPPHSYTIEAAKTRKIVPISPRTRERLDQINAARNKRAAEGRPDRYNLKARVIGFGNV